MIAKLRTSKLAAALSIVIATFAFCAKADDISINGFGSTYYGQAINPQFLPVGFNSTHANFTSFSLLGLNIASRLNDKFSFASQLVALGKPPGNVDPFTMLAQWAFLAYHPADHTVIKAGRQLMPSLMASEYNRVGFLTPYRQTPIAMYSVPFTRFDGVSAYQVVPLNSLKLTVGAFYGSPLLDACTICFPAGVSFTLADAFGLVASLEGRGWEVRLHGSQNYSQQNFTGGQVQGHRQNFAAGYRFDKYNFVSWGEFLKDATPDGATTFVGGPYLASTEGYYVLVGYRLGKFLPRYTYSRGSNNLNLNTGWNGSIESNTVGVNYQATPQTVLKLEWENQRIGAAQQSGLYEITQTSGSTLQSGDAFYLGADFIF